MIVEGLKIMLLGMTTVFLFLSLLTVVISQFANILKSQKPEQIAVNLQDQQIPISVITAAVSAYEEDEQ